LPVPTISREVKVRPATLQVSAISAAPHEGDDLEIVAILDGHLAERRARHDLEVALHRHPGRFEPQLQREIGDVLLGWENEALLAIRALGPDKVEIVVPAVSILAEPPVAVVDTVVDRRGTRQIAEAYLRFLYEPAGQEIAAKHYFRPRDPQVLEKYRSQFAPVELFTVDQVFGGRTMAHDKHFADGGVFD
jgi:sulfate/thiosulfate-binding protein